MPRYQQIDEANMDAEQRRIFNDCKAGPRGRCRRRCMSG